MFLIENPKTFKYPKAPTDIAIIKLAPKTSSIEKAFTSLKSLTTIIEFTKIL